MVAMFSATLVAGVMPGATDLSWGPPADFHKYQDGRHNIDVPAP